MSSAVVLRERASALFMIANAMSTIPTDVNRAANVRSCRQGFEQMFIRLDHQAVLSIVPLIPATCDPTKLRRSCEWKSYLANGLGPYREMR